MTGAEQKPVDFPTFAVWRKTHSILGPDGKSCHCIVFLLDLID